MSRMLLAILLLTAAASNAWGQARPAADPRDALRYGGKPFAYWQKFPRTELKPEWRIDLMRAMGAFGARGYAKEAAVVIVDLLKEYDADAAAFLAAAKHASPDQLVIVEAVWALRKIGPEASPVWVAHLDRPAARTVVELLVEIGTDKIVSNGAVPALVDWVKSKHEEASALAAELLAAALADTSKHSDRCRVEFLRVVTEGKSESALKDAIRRMAASNDILPETAATLLKVLHAGRE